MKDLLICVDAISKIKETLIASWTVVFAVVLTASVRYLSGCHLTIDALEYYHSLSAHPSTMRLVGQSDWHFFPAQRGILWFSHLISMQLRQFLASMPRPSTFRPQFRPLLIPCHPLRV
jgi:hypothetical protein